MPSDVTPDLKAQLAYTVANCAGIEPDTVADAIIVYGTVNDMIGLTTVTCCSRHAISMLAAAIDKITRESPPDLLFRPCE